VLVLSEEFISEEYPLEKLHLLLERHKRPGSNAQLLPLFYHPVTPGRLLENAREFRAAAAECEAATDRPQKEKAALLAQWAVDLEDASTIIGIRTDQVPQTPLIPRRCFVWHVLALKY
jgi:hypothetical protein